MRASAGVMSSALRLSEPDAGLRGGLGPCQLTAESVGQSESDEDPDDDAKRIIHGTPPFVVS